jgi:hypothetical protein
MLKIKRVYFSPLDIQEISLLTYLFYKDNCKHLEHTRSFARCLRHINKQNESQSVHSWRLQPYLISDLVAFTKIIVYPVFLN